MKIEQKWLEKIAPSPSRKDNDRYDENSTVPVYDLCFSPDGSQIIVAAGQRLLVYHDDGTIFCSLKGHKATIHCVVYSKDGKRFASGGVDNTVIIWDGEFNPPKPVLKYTHTSTIQCLAYNPITHQLASATHDDFGLWSQEQKNVRKWKVSSRVCCIAWTPNGLYLALGLYNGEVSIRDKQGEEKVLIKREAPIWSLCWTTNAAENLSDKYDLLAVGCWDQTLSFYELSGEQHEQDIQLGYDPCSISTYSNQDFLLIGGSNRKVL